MIIKITQSFTPANSNGAFRIGEVVTIPDAIARDWIASGFSLEIDDAPAHKPSERAVRKPRETR